MKINSMVDNDKESLDLQAKRMILEEMMGQQERMLTERT